MSDEWLLKASDLEAQLQMVRKRTDQLESFVEAIERLTRTTDGAKHASVSTFELDDLIASVKKL